MDWNLIFAAATLLLAILGAQWHLSGSLDRRFSNIRDQIFAFREDLTKKLEYHERHDDRRFSEISDDIVELRIRNAAVDGVYRFRTDHCPEKRPQVYQKNGNNEDSKLKPL